MFDTEVFSGELVEEVIRILKSGHKNYSLRYTNLAEKEHNTDFLFEDRVIWIRTQNEEIEIIAGFFQHPLGY